MVHFRFVIFKRNEKETYESSFLRYIEKYFFKNIYFNYSLTLISCMITQFFWPLFQKIPFLNIFLNTKFRNVRFSQDTLFVMLLQEESKKLKKSHFGVIRFIKNI